MTQVLYGKGGEKISFTDIDSDVKIAKGEEILRRKAMGLARSMKKNREREQEDHTFVVATPKAGTSAEPEPDSQDDGKELKTEQLDRSALEESAKTLGISFTKKTSDEDLRKAIEAKLGEDE